MDNKPNELKEWISEFSEFLNSEETAPPANLTTQIHQVVNDSLNPSPFIVFGKLAIIALIASSFTLLICPQFGLGTNGPGLMPYLMKISPAACEFGCGVFFVGVGVLVSTFLLRIEEIRVLRQTKFLQISALTASMLGLFICFGSASFFTLEWIWLLGGFSGGLASILGGYVIREKVFVYNR
jgi:hypothetical protein